MSDPAGTGRALRRRATHHDHGAGWTYTRDLGGMVHIRYASDTTGYNSLRRRVARAFNVRRPTRARGRILRPGQPLRRRLMYALVWIKASLEKDRNLPDGQVGPVLAFWEEDGEYIEMVGPTVGEKIADFLEAEPGHPHAIAIAEEMRRVMSLGVERRKA